MIEVLVNDVTPEGMRRVRVVCDEPLEGIRLSPLAFIPEDSQRRGWMDELLGLFYLEATWACREPVRIMLEGQTEGYACVLWKLQPGERVSEVLKCTVALFGERFKCFPQYAFMKKLPKGIEIGFEVDDVMFFEASWVPAGCIVVGTPTPALPHPSAALRIGEGDRS